MVERTMAFAMPWSSGRGICFYTRSSIFKKSVLLVVGQMAWMNERTNEKLNEWILSVLCNNLREF